MIPASLVRNEYLLEEEFSRQSNTHVEKFKNNQIDKRRKETQDNVQLVEVTWETVNGVT